MVFSRYGSVARIRRLENSGQLPSERSCWSGNERWKAETLSNALCIGSLGSLASGFRGAPASNRTLKRDQIQLDAPLPPTYRGLLDSN